MLRMIKKHKTILKFLLNLFKKLFCTFTHASPPEKKYEELIFSHNVERMRPGNTKNYYGGNQY